MIIPANSIECIFNLEDHSAKGSNSGKVRALFNCFVVCIVNKTGISSILPVKPSEDETRGWTNLVAHGEITRNPALFVSDVDNLPDVFFNVVAFAHIGNFLWREFDSAAEHIDELGIKDAASR